MTVIAPLGWLEDPSAGQSSFSRRKRAQRRSLTTLYLRACCRSLTSVAVKDTGALPPTRSLVFAPSPGPNVCRVRVLASCGYTPGVRCFALPIEGEGQCDDRIVKLENRKTSTQTSHGRSCRLALRMTRQFGSPHLVWVSAPAGPRVAVRGQAALGYGLLSTPTLSPSPDEAA